VRRLGVLMVALIAAATLASTVAIPAAQADETCASGYVCLWSAPLFDGSKRLVGTGHPNVWIYFDAPKRSLKNRSGRYLWTVDWSDGSSLCLRPGEIRRGDNGFRADAIMVGSPNQVC
jgi:hypothetical protein